MNHRNILLLLSAFLYCFAPVFAQNELQNRCLLHLDKSFYVSGELIWFKLHLPPTLQQQQFNIKVGILNPSGHLLESFFISSQGNNQGSGYYKIPFECPSGVYQLQLSALENNPKRSLLLAETWVPIYNDLEKSNGAASSSTVQEVATTLPSQDLVVEISLEKNQYQSRETVQAKVQVKNRQGQPVAANLSIAVNDWKLSGTETWPQRNWSMGPTLTPVSLSPQVYTQVQLQSKNSETQNLIGIFFPHNWQLLYTSSRESSYWVEVPAFSGVRQVQFLGHPQPDINVQLLPTFAPKASPALQYTPGILQYLEWSRLRKKIYQLYSSLEMPLPVATLEKDSVPLSADRSLRPADFEAFEDLATFFREISTPLSFKLDRKSGLHSAKMYNPGSFTDYPSAPIFVVDGKITRDADFVARLKCSQIENLDLFYQPDKLFGYFKAIGRSGVVHIRSKAEIAIPEGEAADVFALSGLQAPMAFPALSPAQLKSSPTQAWLRPQLYWNPLLRTDANGQASFSFGQSDDWGTFRIQVLAQGSDGSVSEGSVLYSVGQK